MPRADISAPPETRLVAASLVLALHILALLLLLRALTPGFVARVVDDTVTAVTVPVPKPRPEHPHRVRGETGAAGEAGRKSVPPPQMPPLPRMDLSIRHEVAPQAVSTGSAVISGAQLVGAGTGAMGAGVGTGAGGNGQGGGGGLATPLEKISGDINSTRDYPREGRELRNGDRVVIALTVGTDGRARDCRIQRPSRDDASDQITCQLAMQRFRFRPRRDASGNAVEGVYLWQQRWWDPRLTN